MSLVKSMWGGRSPTHRRMDSQYLASVQNSSLRYIPGADKGANGLPMCQANMVGTAGPPCRSGNEMGCGAKQAVGKT